MEIIFSHSQPAVHDVITLYLSVGWGSINDYDTDTWQKTLNETTGIITAYADGSLVGLARILSDNAHDSYLTDIVVHPAFQNKGIGRQIMNHVIHSYGHTNIYIAGLDQKHNKTFFEKCGLKIRSHMFVASRKANS